MFDEDEPHRHRVAVRVMGIDGREMLGEIFLQAPTYGSSARLDTIGGQLGDDGIRFLPVGDRSRVVLVHTHSIAYIEVAGSPPEVVELDEVGARRAAVQLELGSGEVLRGELVYVLPAGGDSVADLLNSPDASFLVLVPLTGQVERPEGWTRFVQRDAVVRAFT